MKRNNGVFEGTGVFKGARLYCICNRDERNNWQKEKPSVMSLECSSCPIQLANRLSFFPPYSSSLFLPLFPRLSFSLQHRLPRTYNSSLLLSKYLSCLLLAQHTWPITPSNALIQMAVFQVALSAKIHRRHPRLLA